MANTKMKVSRAGGPGRSSKRSPTAAQVRVYRTALKRAIELARVARGQVEFTVGYRCGRNKGDDAEDRELYARMVRQYELCAQRDAAVTRTLHSYARIVRAAK